MRQGDVGEPALLSLDATTVWYAYTRMLLEPVTLWAGPYAGLESLPPTKRKALANAVYSELHQVAGQLCEMVDQPSPGTLIVNVALVDASTADPPLVTISATTPQVQRYDTMGGGFESGVGVFSSRAVLELVARDAMTGAVLWQAVGRDPSGDRPLTSWPEVGYALKSWAAKFGNWMSLIGVCS